MNKEQLTEEIRKACIEANPEIVELTFGCFLSVKGRGDYKTRMCYVDVSVAGNYICTPWVKGAGTTTVKPENVEILGRDIQLADVLMAAEHGNKVLRIEQDGYLQDKHGENGYVWNLSKPLHLQSEETLTFIYGLLKK